jgi:hypothetical protein
VPRKIAGITWPPKRFIEDESEGGRKLRRKPSSQGFGGFQFFYWQSRWLSSDQYSNLPKSIFEK